MRNQRKFKFNMLLTAIVALLLIAVFAYAICLTLSTRIAFAEDALNFEISGDGENWTLKCEDTEIASEQGKFFDPQNNEDAVSVLFKRVMDKALADANTSDYTLNFDLPDIGSTPVGSSTIKYTEKAGGFVIRGIYSPIVSNDVRETLQYRKENGEFENYAFSSPLSGGLAFGQNVDVGRYYVRFVAVEVFTFADVVYSVPRYSTENLCVVEKATPATPDLQTVSVDYGTSVKDIAGRLPITDGLWTLSDEQTDSAIENENKFLHVKDGTYKIKCDYAPHNKNYTDLKGVTVEVKINPRKLTVVINDVFALVGEPKISDFTYRIASSLVGDDREDDLNITINSDSVNTAVAGEYVLTAQIDNPDYVAQSANANSMFIAGGLYTVYATSVSVTAPDGVEFEVLLGTGFKNMQLEIQLCDCVWWSENWAVPVNGHAYRFIFTTDGVRVYPEGSFTVTWKEGTLDNAIYAGTVKADGNVSPLAKLEGRHLTADGDTDVIAFYAMAEDIEMSAIEIASIVMGALCCALAVTLIALVIVYFARRRYFK